jgi:hypothetical protein
VRKLAGEKRFSSENQLTIHCENPWKSGSAGAKLSVGFPPAEIGVEYQP